MDVAGAFSTIITRPHFRQPAVLSAIKKGKSGSNSSNSNSSSSSINSSSKSTESVDRTGGAGGFGNSRTVAPLSKKKLRSVSSSHAGAGSKPLRQAALAFDRIRKAYGVEACRDVYVRSPLNSPTTFWYVGKVAFEPNSSVTTAENGGIGACLSQKRVILEYSRQQLRPQNMSGKYAATLELWLAPGDSEMDVVQNKVPLQPVQGSAADLPDGFTVDTVGYNPEIYVGDELTKGGLRVERREDGYPVKPVFDVNQSA